VISDGIGRPVVKSCGASLRGGTAEPTTPRANAASFVPHALRNSAVSSLPDGQIVSAFALAACPGVNAGTVERRKANPAGAAPGVIEAARVPGKRTSPAARALGVGFAVVALGGLPFPVAATVPVSTDDRRVGSIEFILVYSWFE